MPPKATELLVIVKRTLTNIGVDYQRIIDEGGQVNAAEARERGEDFAFRDHLKGLILALLSNQRPWGPIAENLHHIQEIFHDYNPEIVRNTESSQFVNRLREINCGNRSIYRQMNSLATNIDTLERIGQEYGSLDRFVTSDPPDIIARKICNPGIYKLRQIGYTLAMEYLKNVGIRAAKPDVHVRRLLSGERLGYFQGLPSEQEAYDKVGELAREANCCPTYLDNLLWIFCALNFGNICGAQPRCDICGLVQFCNYPNRRKKR